MILQIMHHPQLHQPWRLDRCNPYTHLPQSHPLWLSVSNHRFIMHTSDMQWHDVLHTLVWQASCAPPVQHVLQ